MDIHTPKEQYTILNIRVLSGIFFTIVLVLTGIYILLTTITTEKNLVKQKEEFLLLLSKNTTQHITASFIIPALESFGRIALNLPEQYRRLDNSIQNAIQGFPVVSTTVYAPNGNTVYTFGKNTVQDSPLFVRKSITDKVPVFISALPSFWDIFWRNYTQPTIYSYYPIILEINTLFQIESTMPSPQELWGILGIGIDITTDINQLHTTYRNLAVFTAILIACSLLSILSILYKTNSLIHTKIVAIEKMKQELAHNERLASMGRTVASIAHEIRNPLGIIYSSIDLLLRKKEQLPERALKILYTVSEETTRLRTVINTFLDYAKPCSIHQTLVDITPLLEKIIIFLEPKIEEKHCTILLPSSKNYILSSERTLLYRAIFNIVNNALEAEDVHTITITTHIEDETFIICVQDDGKGFANLASSKEPFYTTKDTGIGLGLAIVQTILESHSGTVLLSNTKPQGACVMLQFPKELVSVKE